jgi:hypothetical protein
MSAEKKVVVVVGATGLQVIMKLKDLSPSRE